jgi:Asp-tRNA(Asn)/Glu-tRNA(Gln) amidotransferase A subunit family amidase
VIRPAAFCGIAAFKPGYGRVSTEGVIPYAPSLDTVGFFVPEAEDLAVALSVLLDEPETVPGWRAIGVPEGPYLDHASTEARAAFEEQVASLRRMGREVHRIQVLENIAEINRLHNLLAAAEMAATHRAWYAEHEPLYRPRTAAWIREGQLIPETEVETARQGRSALRLHLEALMAEHGIDAWVSPAATGPAPEGITSTGDPVMNLPWTYAGLPVATVPVSISVNGMPLGLQCIGRFGRDAWLAAFANQVWQEVNT